MSKFTVVDGILKKYDGEDAEVVIPEIVTKIGEGVFKNHSEIVSITIPDGVESIGDSAFERCSNLENIIIPDSVTSIGSGAFSGCAGLTGIKLPDFVDHWGYAVFRGCTNLNEICIPEGETRVSMLEFSDCTSLKTLHIPSTVKVLSGYGLPKSITQICMSPGVVLEKVEEPEKFLKNEFEISPYPMIPLSLIKEPNTKLGFFCEYCKSPEKYPNHIAEEYEKYGKSQRSRILREAEAQNKAEVVAYYEKRGLNTTERKLSPKEKAALLQETVDKGSGEELKQILNKHKTFNNSSEMLEKTVVSGDLEKMKILLDHGIEFPEETDCFFNMLRSETLTEETKIAISNLCLSYKQIRYVTNGIAFAACVLHNEKVIGIWKSLRGPDEYIKTYYVGSSYNWHMWNWLFGGLSKDDCLESLRNMLQLSDPNTKPELHIDGNCSILTSSDVMRFVLDNFEVREGFWHVIGYAAATNQIDNLKLISEIWKDKQPNSMEDIHHIKSAVRTAVSNESIEVLEILFETGWVDSGLKSGYDYDWLGWEKDTFLDAIKGKNSDILEILISNDWISYLPSAFSKPDALEIAVKADNSGGLAILEKQGWIRTAPLRDKLIDLAVSENKRNALAWLLEYKNRTADPVKEEKARERKEKQALSEEKPKVISSKKDEWKTVKLADGTYGIDRYSGEDKDEEVLTIPAIIGKRIISTIMKKAFFEDRYYSTKSIYSFYEKSIVIISDGIKIIEDMAFYGYNWLKAIAIPTSVISIGDDVFTDCNPDLIIFGKTGSYAQSYAESSGLKFICNDSDDPIPDFEIYEDSLLKYYGKESNPVIPNGITRIGESAFEGCSNLIEITIPDSVTSIGYKAFQDCGNLKNIIIPNSVERIESNAFQGCTSLPNIGIPNGVKNIGSNAFRNCINLQELVIPNSVINIGSQAFMGCINLQDVKIPESVTSIGSDAFAECTNLSSFSDEFFILNSFLVGYNGSNSEVVIPDKVQVISNSVFAKHDEIKTVSISSEVKSIGYGAFEDCKKLIKINIPESVTIVGDRAFAGCEELTEIILPDCITQIGGYVFLGCKKLVGIKISDQVTSIGNCAFYGCSSLKNINLSENLKTLGSNVFSGCISLVKEGEKFLVINNSLEVYNGTDSNVTIPDNVTIIEDYVFKGHNEITSIIIPDCVTSIGSGAFENCSGLKNINIPLSVTHIGFSAFEGCIKLKKVIIPEGVTEIGSWTFESCKALTAVTIPNSVIEISSSAFKDCSKSKLTLLVHDDSMALEYAKGNGFKYGVIEK